MTQPLKTLINAVLRHFRKPLVILVEKTSMAAELPRKMHDNDAGFDVCAISQRWMADYNCWEYGLGFKLYMPHGYYIELKPRSSLFKTGLIATSSGVIDEGYHGEVMFHFYEVGEKPKPYNLLKDNNRIGQFILHPYTNNVIFKEVDKLPDDPNDRKGGFGSTNK